MPLDRKSRTGRAGPGMVLAAILLLAGCIGGDIPSMLQFGKGRGPTDPAAGEAFAPQKEVDSSLIADLQARRSILPEGGTYARVADAVIAASAGANAAELRVARLKAEARAKNWLPSIGPNVSLTSLGGVAASLLLEQTVFDNGRNKAERAFAAADVELAAVGLSTEINGRVYSGLKYHLEAERARAQASVSANAAGRLAEFETVMGLRVEGGISDRSEQRVIAQQLAEMQATLAADHEAETTARAELAAIAGGRIEGAAGLQPLPAVNFAATEPLAVLQSRGEGARLLAEAKIQRAGLLPGISAVAGLGQGGASPGLRLDGGGLGFGTRASLQALDATGDVVDRQNAEAAENANRRLVALQRQIITLQSREAEGAEVLRQTAGNLDLFTEQYKVGRRTLLELVGQYDSYARLERDQISLKYDIALLQVEIARDHGMLVDGARM